MRPPAGNASVGRALLPRDFLQPCLLLLLYDRSAYGYELLALLSEWGLVKDNGSVYRSLHELEREGLVSSHVERSHRGPCRRRYQLEEGGGEVLRQWTERVAALQQTLDDFLIHYWGAGPWSEGSRI